MIFDWTSSYFMEIIEWNKKSFKTLSKEFEAFDNTVPNILLLSLQFNKLFHRITAC
jgi:hypothetical protein